MVTSPLQSSIAVVQARPFLPFMFIAHEPQMPSRHERRKVSVRVLLRLHLDQRVEHHRAAIVGVDLEGVVTRILTAVGIVAIDLELARLAIAGRGMGALLDLAVLEPLPRYCL
jgi:hypothetical protein